MALSLPAVSATLAMPKASLQGIIDNLRSAGFSVTGPTVRDGAIVYDDIGSVDDLPTGWTDQQEGGSYRLRRRSDEALFGYTVGPHSWKSFLYPPVVRLWQANRNGDGLNVTEESRETPKRAFLGVRSCEIHAIAVQDQVFLQGPFMDPLYKARRENLFIVAVNCGQAGGTCFCASMNTGPKAKSGFDLALTEMLDREDAYFLVEVGTEAGAEMLRGVSYREATAEEKAQAERILAKAAEQMGRRLDTTDIRDLLYRNYEHARWDDVAGRCLTCANCTLVCPTCFCATVEDVTALTGDRAERWRKWDSCFTMDFSYIHGGSIRATPRARYRQWLTHKLATWVDQFGTSGCVGCGRCITWCPVGIDLTEEVRAIRQTEMVPATSIQRDSNGNP